MLFDGNVGVIVGGVYFCNGYIMFKRCCFKNNFVFEYFGYVYLFDGIGKVDFLDCVFSLIVKNVKFNGMKFWKLVFVYLVSGGLVCFKNIMLNFFIIEKDVCFVFVIFSLGFVYMDNNLII